MDLVVEFTAETSGMPIREPKIIQNNLFYF